mgnify:CR=1 FL=1
MFISNERKKYLKNIKKEKIFIIFFQVMILISFLVIWEIFAKFKVINTFLASSPSLIFKTLGKLVASDLFTHIKVTLLETIISFSLASIGGIVIASILWWNKRLAKIFDPYLTVINALPKVALGPLIIIWVGASTKSIIFMALLISLFLSIINIYHDFSETDKNYLTLLKSLGASKKDLFFKVVLPSNFSNIINNLKINTSMAYIGVIMGELLVSKKGLGYLIMYGSQVFNINLVITSVFLLGVFAFLFYYIICLVERIVVKK